MYGVTNFRHPNKEDLQEIKDTFFDAIWVNFGDVTIFNEMTEYLYDVKHIRFIADERQDVSWISRLKKLEWLSLHKEIKGYVDFSGLTALKSVFVDVNKVTENLFQSGLCPIELGLYKYKGTLGELPSQMHNSVRTLILSSAAMSSLEGLELFSKLDFLQLERCLKLIDIQAIETHPELNELHISGSNKIKSYEVIKKLTVLEKLGFENKLLPTLRLLTSKKLKTVRLGSATTIEDLDVEYFMNFPLLEHAIFDKRKGYSMNALELKNKREAQRGEAG